MVVYGSVTDVNRPVDQVSAKASGQTWNGYHVFSASTATRLDTPMMELAQSIQGIPRALIDDQQALTVTESLRNISGVVPRTQGITPNFEPTLIRGFSAMQMIDAQLSYPLTEYLDLTVNIQNLTNTKYYEPFLFLQDEVVSPGPPISAFATLTARF